MRIRQARHELGLGAKSCEVRGVGGKPLREVLDGDLVAGCAVAGEHHAPAAPGAELAFLDETGQLPGSHAHLRD